MLPVGRTLLDFHTLLARCYRVLFVEDERNFADIIEDLNATSCDCFF